MKVLGARVKVAKLCSREHPLSQRPRPQHVTEALAPTTTVAHSIPGERNYGRGQGS